MAFGGACASRPAQQQRRPAATPQRIHVAAGVTSSAPSPPVTPTTSLDTRRGFSPLAARRCLASVDTAKLDAIGLPVDMPHPPAQQHVFVDERAHALSSFLSRAQQLESRRSEKRASALARDITASLDEYYKSIEVAREVDRGRSIHEEICLKTGKPPIFCNAGDMHCDRGSPDDDRTSWSHGCRVLQLASVD